MADTASMLSVAEARARILERFQPLGHETVDLDTAAGRVLAEDLVAGHDLPPFANSSMDGYAVRQAEVAAASDSQPVTMLVSADIPAGSGLPEPLATGTVARIMTGAPVPPGADAVVPIEDTEDGGRNAPAGQIRIRVAPALGANVRPAGQDVRAGQVVLPAGTLIGPAGIGLLASFGAARVRVYQQPLVAIFSTGDELRRVEEEIGPGQIRDSNSHTLAAAAAQYGARVRRLEVAGDRIDEVRARLDEAQRHGAHVIISSAGVSVGAYDVVKAAIEAEGQMGFWKVRMRPGKPLAFGHVRGVPYFGLPGNPVSALVGFEVFVRPAILKLGGRPRLAKPEVIAELATPLDSDGRESYLRVSVRREGERYVARTSGNQGSAVMSALARANGLLIVPEGVTQARAGDRFRVWLLDGVETPPEEG